MPIYRVTVTQRTAKAINYQHRGGSTTIDFRGTELLSGARGEAKVESKQGYIEIEVEFDDLKPATQFGAEYLTYVMWAITPEGRTANLGEVLLNGTKSKLNVTTELQTFGLLVTAEPYFAVSRPSDLIVMENAVRTDTRGKVELIDAKYELLQRGQYERLANPLALKLDERLPLELYEARNAVQIANAMVADRFAAETFQKAEKSLAEAEAYQARKAGRNPVTMTARQAVQTAEDSRAIAVKRQEEEALAAERRESASREALAESASAAAQSESKRVARDAEDARVKAESEAERLKRDNDARTAAAALEAERLRLANESSATA
ncbi:MAG: OmpA family protein, partial [Bryobacteraceae bacterium]|nr:OmpA family protein [Bryobacteraceae bacterium]